MRLVYWPGLMVGVRTWLECQPSWIFLAFPAGMMMVVPRELLLLVREDINRKKVRKIKP